MNHKNKRAKMTIDAGNSSEMFKTIDRAINEPQGVVSAGAEEIMHGYEWRLFLCLNSEI